MRRHPRRAEVNPNNPRCWATDDRSGFIGNHEDMVWQYEWCGLRLINKQILVYPDMLDVPNRQLGSIILPPDPLPIQDARPEQYSIDERTFRIQQDGTQRYQMTGQERLESNLQSGGSQPIYRLEMSGRLRLEEDDDKRLQSLPQSEGGP